MKRPNLSPEQIERIVEMRERRLTEGQIAKAVGCSIGSVSWTLLKEGVDIFPDRPFPPTPIEPVVRERNGRPLRPFTQAEDAQLLELEATGMSFYRMARTLGRRHNSIIGRLRTLARHAARAEAQA